VSALPSNAPNWKNQTIWTGDNLDIMRGMNSESVDLIYLDPPFNSKANYAAPIGSKAAGAAFKDTWGLDDINLAWHGLIKSEHPGLYDLLTAVQKVHGDSMMSYLIYMAIRVMEMRRLLKNTGSIYLHCDPTASHYLKTLMDSIFGPSCFKNEIVWRRTKGRSDAQRFGRVHDVILFYSRPGATWNTQYLPHDPEYIKVKYRNSDARGRWRSADLTASGLSSGESGGSWQGFDPSSIGRHWAVPVKGGMNDFIIRHNLIPGWPDAYPTVHVRLDALAEADLIHWSPRGGMPSLKRYLDSTKGIACDDVVVDIPPINSQAKERIGYPTQKPLALLQRLIRASTNEHDIVFDPFCGCATACIAAEQLQRQWVGIDISPKAADLVRSRMQEEVGMFFTGAHRTDIPKRTDLGKVMPYNDIRNKRYLYGEQGGYCNGCGTHFEMRHLTVDHIIAESKGGTDHVSNLQLLCGSCNSIKGTKSQAELLVLLTDKGYIKRHRTAGSS